MALRVQGNLKRWRAKRETLIDKLWGRPQALSAKEIWELTAHGARIDQIQLAKTPGLDIQAVRRLWRDDRYGVRIALLDHQELPDDLVAEALCDIHPVVRAAAQRVAGERHTPFLLVARNLAQPGVLTEREWPTPGELLNALCDLGLHPPTGKCGACGQRGDGLPQAG